MHLRLILISQVLLLLLVVESSWGLRCRLPCDVRTCPQNLRCRGGKVLEPCQCCYECAKQKGESCGGNWNLSGTCDKGLECHERRCRVRGVEVLTDNKKEQNSPSSSRTSDLESEIKAAVQDSTMYPRLMLISQVLLLLVVVESSWGLRCLSCDRVECSDQLTCPGGKVLEPCKCCYKCAKQEGEMCGGPWNLSGTCDKGLECREGTCRGAAKSQTSPQFCLAPNLGHIWVAASDTQSGQQCGPLWVLLLLLLVKSSWGLRCEPCDMVKCPDQLTCPGGKVLGPCKCCYQCAKQKGERLILISQVLLVLLLLVETNWGCCGSCDGVNCPTAQCPGGQVLDVCGCCYECAKQNGEICGGDWDRHGKCDKGLRCMKHGRSRHREGVCRGIKPHLEPPQMSLNKPPGCPVGSVLWTEFLMKD
ncbi:hypothetical protein NFI96_005672 [Prochilodus magdalenae]|nr:hypothetical protein NFI96_005672 [Prochilodus magdalenae]